MQKEYEESLQNTQNYQPNADMNIHMVSNANELLTLGANSSGLIKEVSQESELASGYVN